MYIFQIDQPFVSAKIDETDFFLDIYLTPNCMYRYNLLIIIDVSLFRGSGWLSELGSWIT